MPVAWFISPYERDNLTDGVFILKHRRRPVVAKHLSAIAADGGSLAWSEGLGDLAVAKVNASEATLTAISGEAGMLTVPRRWVRLIDGFGDMTNGERNQIENRLLAAGFSQAEIDAAMGSTLALWRTKSLQDLLTLFTSRRLAPRRVGNVITLDGPPLPTRPITDVDAKVIG